VRRHRIKPDFPISTLSLHRTMRRPPLTRQSQIAVAVVEWHRGWLGSSAGWPGSLAVRQQKRRDPSQHAGKTLPRELPFRQQQSVIARMSHQPIAGLHEAVLQTCQKPVPHLPRQRQYLFKLASCQRVHALDIEQTGDYASFVPDALASF
jgi:hypothetical protein